jgi:hypothetical protein
LRNKQTVQLVLADEDLSYQQIISQQVANLDPDEEVSFKCGTPGSNPPSQGYQFEFLLNADYVDEFERKKI